MKFMTCFLAIFISKLYGETFFTLVVITKTA